MSEPMRFSLKHNGQLSCVEHCPEGEYVLHSDYARLKAEVERLRASSFVTAVPVEQYERLREAGDAMYQFFLWVEKNKSEEVEKTMDEWEAAKEGKPSV